MSQSLTSRSEKQHQPRFRSYVDVFFGLFDRDRSHSGTDLLASKLFPAVSSKRKKKKKKRYKDERLPIAKLLLIADENTGGFPAAMGNSGGGGWRAGDACEEETCNGRMPGVVARLMGLESMPAPGSPRESKGAFYIAEKLAHTHYMEVPHSGEPDGLATKAWDVEAHISNALAVRSKQRSRVPSDRFDDPKSLLFSKLLPLSPRSVSPLCSVLSLSPSKHHNQLLSPIKSPLAVKKSTARLIEAAARVLEPSRPLYSTIQTSVARPLLMESDVGRNADKEETRKVPASKKAPFDSVTGISRGLPSSRSWNGQNSERSIQGERPPQAVGRKKVEQFIAGAVLHSFSSQCTTSKQEPKPQARTRAYGRKREGEKPTNSSTSSGETKLEVRYKELNPSPRSHLNSMKQQIHLASACNEAVVRRGNVKDVPTSGQILGPSRNVKEDSGNECRRLSGGNQESNYKKSSQEAAGKNPRRKQAVVYRHDGSTFKDSFVCSSAAADEMHRNNSGRLYSDSAQASLSSAQNTFELTVTSQNNGSSILSYTKIFGSRQTSRNKEGESKKMDMTQKKGESPFMRSFLRRKAGLGTVSSGKKSSIILNPVQVSFEPLVEGKALLSGDVSDNNIQTDTTNQELDLSTSVSEDTSTSNNLASLWAGSEQPESNCNELGFSSINEALVQFSVEGGSKSVSIESQIQSMDMVSPLTPCSLRPVKEQIEDTIGGASTFRKLDVQRNVRSNIDEIGSACCSDIGGSENSVHSSCGSCCSRRDSNDTASTDALTESSDTECLFLSGKTTTVILQELLMAVNTCGPHLPAEEMPDLSGTFDSHDSFSRYSKHNDSQEGETSNGSELQHLQSAETASCGGSLPEINEDTRFPPPKARMCPDDAYESSSEAAFCQDYGLSSPISILESPFQDESSNSLNTSGRKRGLKPRRTSDAMQDSKHTSTWNEKEYVGEMLRLGWEDLKLHQWRQMQGLPPIDPALSTGIERWLAEREQTSGAQSVAEVGDGSLASSETVEEVGLPLGRAGSRAARQNRKLIFDCVNEELSLRLGMYGRGEFWEAGPVVVGRACPLQEYVERSVCKQMEDWRERRGMLMVDEVVEKEMDRWAHIEEDVAQIGMEIEDSLLGWLVKEMVLDFRHHDDDRPVPMSG